jgi:nitroreductase
MTTATRPQLIDALEWRYATKAFDAQRRLDDAVWNTLERALQLTPSSYGLQPWKFVVVTSPELKAALRPHAWNQSQITDCSHLVVLLAKREITKADITKLLDATAAERGLSVESLAGYGSMMEGDLINGPRREKIGDWAANQVYIALGNLMTAAALLGVDTCSIEGFVPAEFDRILNLNDSPYRSAVVCAVGYRSEQDTYAALPKVRFPLADIIEHR